MYSQAAPDSWTPSSNLLYFHLRPSWLSRRCRVALLPLAPFRVNFLEHTEVVNAQTLLPTNHQQCGILIMVLTLNYRHTGRLHG